MFILMFPHNRIRHRLPLLLLDLRHRRQHRDRQLARITVLPGDLQIPVIRILIKPFLLRIQTEPMDLRREAVDASGMKTPPFTRSAFGVFTTAFRIDAERQKFRMRKRCKIPYVLSEASLPFKKDG